MGLLPILVGAALAIKGPTCYNQSKCRTEIRLEMYE